MAKYTSGRQRNLKVGISSYSENTQVVSVIGRVGIGSTVFNADYDLDVRGTTKLSGNIILGNSSSNLINVPGRISSNFYPDGDGTYDVGRGPQIGSGANRWKDANFLGIGKFDGGVDAHNLELGIGSPNLIYSTSGNLELNSQSGTTNIDDILTISGNTGIGTANPTSKLWVDGDGYFTGILTAQRLYSSLYGEFTGGSISGTSIVGTALSISGISTVGFLTATNISVSGVTTSNAYYIGTSQVISSGRQLQNIASLDATTTTTIETAIQQAPNDFTSLNISGISTLQSTTLIGGGTSTGTTSQRFQVTGGAYVSGNLGIGTTNPQAKFHSYGVDDTLSTVFGAPTNTLIEVKDDNPWAIAFRRTDLGPTADVAAAWVDNNRNFLIANGLPDGGFRYSVGLHTEYVKLYAYDQEKFSTLGVGATVIGTLFANQLSVSGISTFAKGPVLIGSATSTGTESQLLQVTGGAYVSGNLGIGTTTPSSALTLTGDVKVSGIVTATTFSGTLSGYASTAGYATTAFSGDYAQDGATSAYASKRVLQYNETTKAVTYSNTLDAVRAYITGYGPEIHVSPVALDDTGKGTIGDPVKTIAQAQVLAAAAFETTGIGERKTIILHPGDYVENVTINTQFTVLTTHELVGKNTTLSGTLTITKGCTIDGLKMNNLVISATSATGSVDIIGCTVTTSTTKTSSAYTVFRGCDLSSSTLSITGTGTVILIGGNYFTVTVNNASAGVLSKAVVSMGPVTLTAGTLQLSDTLVYSATNTSNAITQSAGSVLTLNNSQTLIPSLTNVARNSFGGFYSILHSVYDKPNSTFGGTSLNAISYSQYINADRIGIGTTNPTSALTVTGDTYISGILTATDINSASDIRLKTNIKPFENTLEKIVHINGVSFNWIENNAKSGGIIAQDVEKVFPELVNGGDHKTVNYNGLIGVLVESIKELKQEIEDLKLRLNET
jgi:hypothetical protein